MSQLSVKEELQAKIGREPRVVMTQSGKFLVLYLDMNNPNPTGLAADTEELAYSKLLEYLKAKETQSNDGRNQRT